MTNQNHSNKQNKSENLLDNSIKRPITDLINETLNIYNSLKSAYESCNVFTVKEVSQILKTNIDYVHSLRKSGLLTFIKIGQYKIRHESLIRFLEMYDGFDLTDPFNIKKLNDN